MQSCLCHYEAQGGQENAVNLFYHPDFKRFKYYVNKSATYLGGNIIILSSVVINNVLIVPYNSLPCQIFRSILELKMLNWHNKSVKVECNRSYHFRSC